MHRNHPRQLATARPMDDPGNIYSAHYRILPAHSELRSLAQSQTFLIRSNRSQRL